MDEKVKKLLKRKAGIQLDLGGGGNPQSGFVNIDIRDLPQVDIVHDLEKFPWPLPDECVTRAVASHLVEHINPHKGVFIGFMDEVWRVLKFDGDFLIATPYAGSSGYWQDPTHINPCNRNTWAYFDPLDPIVGNGLYGIYKPKPWKIEYVSWNEFGNMEVHLKKRRLDKSYG
jgi:SAM-dependent methyltransferase